MKELARSSQPLKVLIFIGHIVAAEMPNLYIATIRTETKLHTAIPMSHLV